MERMSQDYAPGKKALVLPSNCNAGRVVSLIGILAPLEKRVIQNYRCFNHMKKAMAWVVEPADGKAVIAAENTATGERIECPITIVPQHQLMLLDDDMSINDMDEEELPYLKEMMA